MIKTNVLISGAGPTGLMLAAQLSRFGIDYILIDQKKGVTHRTKALGVHARSMEIYNQLGLIDKVMEEGNIAVAAVMGNNGKIVGELPLGRFGENLSAFPFLFILEQSKNEKILYDYIQSKDAKVDWQTTLVGYEEMDDGVVATIKNEQAELVKVRADYVVGADGARSLVRSLIGVEFKGGTYEDLFLVADIKVDWEFEYNKLYVFLEKNTFVVFFPMKAEKRFRIVSIIPDKYEDVEELKFEDVKGELMKNLSFDLQVSELATFGTYKVHHKYVDQFNKGRIFLAGDAAHLHSPAGAQGMNTGLQDAYNLAWKLALTIKESSNKKLLNSYHIERHPNAVELIKTTDTAFSFFAGNRWYHKFTRSYLFPLFAGTIMKRDFTRTAMFKRISQIRIGYPKSPFSVGQLGAWKAGDRLPYFELFHKDIKTNIHELLNNNQFNLLCFGQNKIIELEELIRMSGWQDWIKIQSIEENEINKEVLQKFKLKDSFICLIRPDMHIGYLHKVVDTDHFLSYLKLYK